MTDYQKKDVYAGLHFVDRRDLESSENLDYLFYEYEQKLWNVGKVPLK